MALRKNKTELVLLIHLILLILIQRPALWHTLTLGMGFLFLSIKPHRQLIKLLTEKSLKIA